MRHRRAFALLAMAPLLGAWCDPYGNCNRPLPPAFGRPYPTERPYLYDPYGRRDLPPTRTPQHRFERYGEPYPPGYARPAPPPRYPNRHYDPRHDRWW